MNYSVLGFLLVGLLTQSRAQECGQRKVSSKNTFVVGGEDAQHGDWPWQALVVIKLPRGTSLCGGSLINQQWVLTAAHCVTDGPNYPATDPSLIEISLGKSIRGRKEGSEVTMKASKVVYHKKYSQLLNYDIALVKLEKPVTFTNYIQPICLADKEVPDGTSCYVTGWGKMKNQGRSATKLQQGLLHKQPRSACARHNDKMVEVPIGGGKTGFVRLPPVTEQMICGAQPGTILSACQGDSGGPYVCKIGTRWELHGVVSWGSPRCDVKEAYSVFANVAFFKNWIKRKVDGTCRRRGKIYQKGQKIKRRIKMKCLTCTCKGRWYCTKKKCPGVCKDKLRTCSNFKNHCRKSRYFRSICCKTCYT